MPYVSKIELGVIAVPEILLPWSLFLVLPQNGPKLNVHASKEFGCEGKTQINCASGKGLTTSK